MTSQEWFNQNVVEDKEFVSNVGEQAVIKLRERFNIKLKNKYVPIAIYASILNTIKSYLHEKEKSKQSYSINIADMLEIGYTSGFESEDTDAEKIGNYMIFYRNIENSSVWEKNCNELSASVLCTEWMAANVQTSIEDLKAISAKANNDLKANINLWLPSPDMVIPIFCTVHSQVISTITMMYSTEKTDDEDYSFNFAGLYDISVIELEDGLHIQLKPQVSDKGTFKNDNGISSKYE